MLKAGLCAAIANMHVVPQPHGLALRSIGVVSVRPTIQVVSPSDVLLIAVEYYCLARLSDASHQIVDANDRVYCVLWKQLNEWSLEYVVRHSSL